MRQILVRNSMKLSRVRSLIKPLSPSINQVTVKNHPTISINNFSNSTMARGSITSRSNIMGRKCTGTNKVTLLNPITRGTNSSIVMTAITAMNNMGRTLIRGTLTGMRTSTLTPITTGMSVWGTNSNTDMKWIVLINNNNNNNSKSGMVTQATITEEMATISNILL